MKNSDDQKKGVGESAQQSKALMCISDEKIADYISGCDDDEKTIEAYMSQDEENLDKIMTAMMATRIQSERDRKRDETLKHDSAATNPKEDDSTSKTLEFEVHIWVLVLIAIVFFAAIAWAILK